MITKKQKIILTIVFLFSPFLVKNFQTTPHMRIIDLFYIFIFCFLTSFLYLFVFANIVGYANKRFFSSPENLIFFTGSFFIVSDILPLFISYFKGTNYILDILAPLIIGIALILSVYIKFIFDFSIKKS